MARPLMAIMPGLSSTTWATTVNCELIHVDKWRLLTPAAMVGTGYLRGMGFQSGHSSKGKESPDASAVNWS